jgi:hypothetical protein
MTKHNHQQGTEFLSAEAFSSWTPFPALTYAKARPQRPMLVRQRQKVQALSHAPGARAVRMSGERVSKTCTTR